MKYFMTKTLCEKSKKLFLPLLFCVIPLMCCIQKSKPNDFMMEFRRGELQKDFTTLVTVHPTCYICIKQQAVIRTFYL